MSNEIKAQGTLLQLGTVASPQTFAAVANVTGITGPDGQKPDIDVTNLSDVARRFLTGLPDFGSVSLELNYSPDETTHDTLYALFLSGALRQWRILFSNATTYLEFNATVQTFPFQFAIDDVVKITVGLRVSGQVTLINP